MASAASFSESLRRLIERSGLSRYEIARQSGVSESSLSRFLSGERGLTTDSVDRLAAFLGLSLTVTRKRNGDKR